MKQFLLGLSVSLAFIAGCIVATAAQGTAVRSSHASSASTATWEYKCPNSGLGVESEFNSLGSEGWELISSDATCFKRQL